MKAREQALCTVMLAVCFMALAAPSALSQQDEAQPPRHFKLSEVFISITRGSCEGECPIYTVAVHGGGMVAYQGEENVATTGQQVEMISPQAVENLLNAVYSAGFMGMRDSYLSSIAPKVTEGGVVILEYRGATGSPRSILVLTIGGYTKQVVFQPEHAPSDLVKLADLIDELTGSAKWTKGR